MKSYTQLTQEQRYQIHAFLKSGLNQSVIATELGVHKSTICRELQRNTGQRGYRPQQADGMAKARQQQRAASLRIEAGTWSIVEEKLRLEWSPEQVSGWLLASAVISVSHERIYQYIYADQSQGGTLHEHLRCRKLRRKRYGKYDRRGQIPNRMSIDERPPVVAAKTRVGDWEVDTIVGAGRRQALVSLTERKSKLTLLHKVERATSEAVQAAITKLLAPLQSRVHTITSDNGREFARHQEIAQALGADFYFAHPYSPWERGLNENTNGLVRQYFPKNTDLANISQQQVDAVMKSLNHRPRKTLDFDTPHQVFFNNQLLH